MRRQRFHHSWKASYTRQYKDILVYIYLKCQYIFLSKKKKCKYICYLHLKFYLFWHICPKTRLQTSSGKLDFGTMGFHEFFYWFIYAASCPLFSQDYYSIHIKVLKNLAFSNSKGHFIAFNTSCYNIPNIKTFIFFFYHFI